MSKRRERLATNIGLRLGGIGLLILAWAAGTWLCGLIPADGSDDMTALQFFLAGATFLSGCMGSALLVVGPHLWDEVEISERWSPRSGPHSGI